MQLLNRTSLMTVYKYAQSTLFFKNPVDFGSDTMYENTHDICQC